MKRIATFIGLVLAGLTFSAPAMAENYVVTHGVWSHYQKYLRAIGSTRPGAFAITTDGAGASAVPVIAMRRSNRANANTAQSALALPIATTYSSATRSRDPRSNWQAGRRAPQSGAMPFSVSSRIASAFFLRWARPMPRRMCGALVNWMLV